MCEQASGLRLYLGSRKRVTEGQPKSFPVSSKSLILLNSLQQHNNSVPERKHDTYGKFLDEENTTLFPVAQKKKTGTGTGGRDAERVCMKRRSYDIYLLA